MNLTSQADTWLRAALALPPDSSAFPWQRRLLAMFLEGKIPRALDLPTGLGKTAVIAIWLVARALGADLPLRLVYVVDRRAVVDQATTTALGLRQWVADHAEVAAALGLQKQAALPISTLRGQFADNREWLDDPGRPTIIVGTVDMIGSRLLFQGYGTSRKMRPYQAGLLGIDSLFVIDEAHLVPPFEQLIETVTKGEHMGPAFGPKIGLPPRLLSLSATGRDHGPRAFRLDAEDVTHDVVSRRLRATKRIVIAPPVADKDLPSALAIRAWEEAGRHANAARVLVFSNRRTDAEKAKKELEKIARNAKLSIDAELFVGARRGHERTKAAEWLSTHGFIAGRGRPDRHAFVFATAAGEVGVDLDADHAISDVVAWERMVQRLGRVNRRGLGDATIHVLPTDAEGLGFDADAVQRLLSKLPRGPDGSHDASPAALSALTAAAKSDEELAGTIQDATSPDVLRPALSRPLLDAWAMTSLREHTGRPEVGPWLRGWIDDVPNTVIVWRAYLGVVATGDDGDLSRYLEATPVHPSERLETASHRAATWLLDVSKRLLGGRKSGGDRKTARTTPLAVLDTSGEIRDVFDLQDVDSSPSGRKRLERLLRGTTLVVDASLAGLSSDGLLDATCASSPPTADAIPSWSTATPTDEEGLLSEGDERIADGRQAAGPEADDDPSEDADVIVPFRLRKGLAQSEPRIVGAWRERLRLARRGPDGDVTSWLVVERYRSDAATEEDRSTARTQQRLAEHQDWASTFAGRIANAVHLPAELAGALRLAARLHDEGKRARIWQDAFSAPSEDRPYAKTRGPVNVHRLFGYRHELGSLPYAEEDPEVRLLADETRDLVLHLIAAHHGFARPVIPTQGCEDAPPSVIAARAQAVARRFVRMSERWGPWGLAYLEALMRAADQQASRALDEGRSP